MFDLIADRRSQQQNVEFLSFRELLESIRVPPGRELEFRAFRDWLARQPRVRAALAHKLFEEFKGVLTGLSVDRPWLTREEYAALGVKRSIFLEDERDGVYELFERYLAWLTESGRYDSNIVAQQYLADATPRYDFAVVDEVQDLTNVQLALVLRLLRRPGQFLLCGDSNQIVHPSFFSWSQLKTLFFTAESLDPRAFIHLLRTNYRNAARVTELANRLLRIKQRRFGSIDRETNYLVETASSEPGAVEFLADERAVSNVYVVESDTRHELLRLLGLEQTRERLELAEQKSSLEEWQYEAHRLEQQGKLEQAEEVRRTVLQVRVVPWPVLEVQALADLAGRALDPSSISNKPRQQLYEYAVFNDEPAWVMRLAALRFEPAQGMLSILEERGERLAQVGAKLIKRHHVLFESRNLKEVLRQVDQYGPDFRNPFDHTPLMLAAARGNVALVEALLARGAEVELSDNHGRLAFHHVLLRAFLDPEYARAVRRPLSSAGSPGGRSHDRRSPGEAGCAPDRVFPVQSDACADAAPAQLPEVVARGIKRRGLREAGSCVSGRRAARMAQAQTISERRPGKERDLAQVRA